MDSYRTQAEDTSREAEQVQIAVWRSMTPVQKFACLAQLQEFARRVAEAGIRARHPNADRKELFLRYVARRLDPETMRRAYGWDPDGAGP